MSTSTQTKPRSNSVTHTEQTDAQIMRAYNSDKFGKSATLNRLSEQLGIPITSIHRRATELGCTSARNQHPWTDAEIEILEQNAHKTLEAINAQLRNKGYRNRSLEGIRCQLFKIGITRRQARIDAGLYSAQETARMTGLTANRVVQLIEKGHIKATTRTDTKQKEWLVPAKNIKEFMVEYAAEINIAKADKYWLIYCLAGKL